MLIVEVQDAVDVRNVGTVGAINHGVYVILAKEF